ncbi:hypothetical protein HYV43_02415 [Candidatus Micrarchaeota archaeon]|nr:hypothetical protein [Candidatus Micrarchaeota archaeon]
MVFRKLLKGIAAFFSPREPAKEKIEEPAWQGATPFEKLASKVEFWKSQAVHAAMPHARLTQEPIHRLKEAIRTVTDATPKDVGIHERIALQHQRDFATKTLALQSDLDALVFPTDFDGLLRDTQAFHSTLAAIQEVVKDNRYIYAFFKQDLAQFNSTMNELADRYAAMHHELEAVRVFSDSCAEVERKRTDDSLNRQLERIQAEIADTHARQDILRTQEKAQASDADPEKLDTTTATLAEMKKAESDAGNRFYTALDALEGPLKKYAHGKEPGAHAKTAERYLSVKEDFLKDCLLDTEELAPLLAELAADSENPAITEFIEKRNAWADEFEQARENRIEIEHQLAALRSLQDRKEAITNSLKETERFNETLEKKAAAISETIAGQRRELELEAERLLATEILPAQAPSGNLTE